LPKRTSARKVFPRARGYLNCVDYSEGPAAESTRREEAVNSFFFSLRIIAFLIFDLFPGDFLVQVISCKQSYSANC